MLEYIFIAKYSNPKEKLPYLKKASFKLDLLKFFFRVSWEINCLNNKKYILISEKLDEIGRMIGGWIGKTSESLKETSA